MPRYRGLRASAGGLGSYWQSRWTDPVTPGLGFSARNRAAHRHEGHPHRRIAQRPAPHESPPAAQIGTRFNDLHALGRVYAIRLSSAAFEPVRDIIFIANMIDQARFLGFVRQKQPLVNECTNGRCVGIPG